MLLLLISCIETLVTMQTHKCSIVNILIVKRNVFFMKFAACDIVGMPAACPLNGAITCGIAPRIDTRTVLNS